MISRYNRVQTIKAVFFFGGGLLGCVVCFAFFFYLSTFIAWQFGFHLSRWISMIIGLVGIMAAWFSGYRTWKARGGLFSYHESGLYHDLGDDSASAHITDLYARRITGPAYMLGQIFMAGPQLILRALTMLANRVPWSSELELRLEHLLTRLKAANKWQGLSDYPGHRAEILYLARMGMIDFSVYKGSPRFKAR